MKKILIINSDSPSNRGDRAILLGNIELLRHTFGDDVEIWALSEYPERDEEWYGIQFIPLPVQSLSPLHMLILLKRAREFDYIFWGGGELLKDYTNKLALIYWVVKIYLISLVNPRLYGMFQGIGPTNSKLGERLIRRVVDRCRVFFTRDEESKIKLEKWGVKTKIVSSFDPAILESVSELSSQAQQVLKVEYGINEEFLENYIGVGPRNWFHYKKSGWLPYKYHKYIPFMPKATISNESLQMQHHLALLLDDVVEALDANVIFFPMHMSETENDAGVSNDIIRKMKQGVRAKVLDKDNISPQDYLNIIKYSKLFIGVRLHSTIIATVVNTPSFVFYYVDKGRLYFEQIGLSKYSTSIDNILDKTKISEFRERILALHSNRDGVKDQLEKNIAKMRKQIREVFTKEISDNG